MSYIGLKALNSLKPSLQKGKQKKYKHKTPDKDHQVRWTKRQKKII